MSLKKGASKIQPFNSPRLKLWIITQVTRACDCQVAIHCGGGPKRQCVKATNPHLTLTQSECPRFVLRWRRRGEVSQRARGEERESPHQRPQFLAHEYKVQRQSRWAARQRRRHPPKCNARNATHCALSSESSAFQTHSSSLGHFSAEFCGRGRIKRRILFFREEKSAKVSLPLLRHHARQEGRVHAATG